MHKGLRLVDINNYLKVQKEYIQKNDSSGKQSDPENFLKSQFVIF